MYTRWKEASQLTRVVKNLLTNAGDARDAGSIPGSGRHPGVGNGNPLQCSCREKSHGQRTLAGLQSMGPERVGCNWVTEHIVHNLQTKKLF